MVSEEKLNNKESKENSPEEKVEKKADEIISNEKNKVDTDGK